MTTANPSAAIAEEVRLVQDDIARLRETAADLRRRIGERDEKPTDPEERSALIEAAEEQEALIDQLEAGRGSCFVSLATGADREGHHLRGLQLPVLPSGQPAG